MTGVRVEESGWEMGNAWMNGLVTDETGRCLHGPAAGWLDTQMGRWAHGFKGEINR